MSATGANSLREHILHEVEHFSPETLELLYNFIQELKETEYSAGKREKHPLSEFAGMLSYNEGQKMIDCVTAEFNNIEGEGEW